MKTTLKMLTLTGLLTVGGLTSCGQTFDETPAVTTPTSGTVTLMPGQTVTGIDGVQITAPKDIEGWDGKPLEILIERVNLNDSKYDIDRPAQKGYRILSQDKIIVSKEPFIIDFPGGDKNTIILLSKRNPGANVKDYSDKYFLYENVNANFKNNIISVKYHILGDSTLDDTYLMVDRIGILNQGTRGLIGLSFENIECSEKYFSFENNDCFNKTSAVKKYATQQAEEFQKMYNTSPNVKFISIQPYKRIAHGKNYQYAACWYRTDETGSTSGQLQSPPALYDVGTQIIHICDQNVLWDVEEGLMKYTETKDYKYLTTSIRHELFHAFQVSIILDGYDKLKDNGYVSPFLKGSKAPSGSNFWMIEGLAVASESSSSSTMSLRLDQPVPSLDFTLPFLGNGREISYKDYSDSEKVTNSFYRYQDFFVFLGKSGNFGLSRFKGIISYAGNPNMQLDEEFNNLNIEGIKNFGDAWWQFNLDRAIENRYPLRSDDLRCQVNKNFIEPSSISWNLSVPSTKVDMSVDSYDTDYRFYKISGEGAKDITVTPASNFKVGQDSIRAAVYLRTGEGSDVTCNSIAPQADGTYKIPNVKAGDQILLAAGNLKEVANPVNLDFTLTTAAPASYKRVKVNFGKALYYDNAPSPLSESARRGGKVYAQDFGRSMAISENEFWIDTNGLASGEKPSIGVEPLKGFTLDNSRITGTCEVTYAPSSHSLLFNNLKDDCEINLQFRFQVSDFKLDCPREVYGIGHAKYPGEQSCNAIAYGKSDYYDGPLAPQPPIEVYTVPNDIVKLSPFSSSPTKWLITPQNNGTVTIGATTYDSSYGNNDRQGEITNSNEVMVQSYIKDEISPPPFALSNVTLTCLPGQIEVNTSRDVCTATATASDGTTAKDVTNEATFEFSPVNSAIATITNSDQQWIGKVTGVSAGEARFTVTATWNGERRTSAESGAVQIVAPTPVIDPALQGTAEITVIDAATAAPVSSVVFKACTTTGNCTPVTTREQSPGVYVLALQEGTYTLQVSREGYLPATMQNVAIVRGQKTILERHLILDKTIVGDGTIRGRLLNAVSGAGVANVKLDIRQELYNATGAVVTAVTTDSEGRYSLNLPTGYYTATATREGYLPVVFNLYAIGGKVVDLGDRAMSPVLAATGDWRVVLTWGASPSDLDSHLTGPTANGNRFHVYFYNPSYQDTSTNVLLDRDDTSSYGPETTTIKSTTPGLLKYSVHDYSNRGYSGSALSNSGAKVELYRGSSAQALATFYVPAGNGDLWTVFTIDTTNPQAPKITPINTITTVGGSSSVQSVPNPNVEQQKSGFDLRSPLW